MQSNAGLAWERVGSVLLIVHAPRTPTESEWSEMMDDPAATRPSGLVVVSNGVRPSPAQRGEIQERFGKTRIGVLTDSAITRGAITALRWFGINIRAFPPTNAAPALRHAGVPAEDIGTVVGLLQEMDSRMLQRVGT